jgi:hypothetical protein
VTVPETTVDKNNKFLRPDYEIRLTGKGADVAGVPNTYVVQNLCYTLFRGCLAGTHPRHDLAAFGSAEYVRHWVSIDDTG